MARDLEIALDHCLDALLCGKSIEDCLQQYPHLAADLEPLLRVGGSLTQLPEPVPRPEAVRAALVRVGAARRERKDVFRSSLRTRLSNWFVLPRLLPARAVLTALVFLVSLWGVGAVSAGSQPGDFLYPLKLVTERVRFALTLHPEGRAELRLTFADARLAELVEHEAGRGSINPVLLQKLLHEAELALDEIHAVPDDRFQLFLKRVEHFNAYQQEVLTRLAQRVPSGDAQSLREAISLCEERRQWIRRADQGFEAGHPVDRRWSPACRCR